MPYLMKNTKQIILNFFYFLLLVCGLISCEKEHDVAPFEGAVPANAAQLKFINTAIGSLGINFGVNMFINDIKSSSVGVTIGLPIGTGHGGIYPISANYAAVPAGNQTLKLIMPFRAGIPATATACPIPESPTTTIATTPLVTEAGKYYSRFLVGTAPSYSIFEATDDLSVTNINQTNAFIRFFNFITNTPVTGYDLVFVRTRPATLTTPAITSTVKTFLGVRYLGGSPVFEAFIPIPATENIADVVQLRVAGTTTVVATVANGFVARPGRVYTFFARGVVGGLTCGMPAATAIPSATANIPVITFYTNR